jgi:hypothetical protein
MVGSQLVTKPRNSIIQASNMIDLTINKTPITSDDFQEKWQVVQDKKREKKNKSEQPINQIITTKGSKVTKPKRTVTPHHRLSPTLPVPYSKTKQI